MLKYTLYTRKSNTPDFRLQNKCFEFTATNTKGYFVVKIMIFNCGLKDSLDSDLVCQIQLIHIFTHTFL